MSNNFTKYFGAKFPEELVPKLEHLLKIFSFSVEELYINWETFVTVKNDNNDTFDIENFNKLEQYIQDKLAKKHTTRTPNNLKIRKLKSTTSSPLTFGSSPSQYDSSVGTPVLKRVKLDEKTPIKQNELLTTPLQSSPFKPTQQSGEIIESLNESLKTVKEETQSKCKVALSVEAHKYNFRSMRMKLLESADVLDEQIESMSTIFAEHFKILLSNPTIQSQDEIYAVGRIVSDNPTVIDGLNSQSLCLETSRLQGVGKRIPLDLSKLDNFELFPGQIVCIKGKNPTGQWFHVVEILNPPLLGPSVFDVEELNHDTDTEILIFKGPFTLNSQLNFDVFTKATQEIMNNANIVILLGPFVDINNRAIVNGEFPQEFNNFTGLDDFYKNTIKSALTNINPSIQIIMIPDVKDILTRSPAFPQPAYPKLKSMPNLIPYPNPSIFEINDISLGASNIDIFRNLKDIIGKNSNPNRFERIVNFIIEQRKFYPVFPSTEPLNVPYLGLTEFQSVPDVLILPSDLKPFAKIIKNVLVINPGGFIKPNSGGTYAKLYIKSANSDNTDTDESGVTNKIWQRAKVEIIKS